MQGKRWCFTLNNPVDTELESFHNATDRAYVIIGKELGEQGTAHWQGYITFTKNKRLAAVRAINGRAHWEIARGSTDDHSILRLIKVFCYQSNCIKSELFPSDFPNSPRGGMIAGI
jgi:hypothetical protein